MGDALAGLIRTSRATLLGALRTGAPFTYFRTFGNIGDRLINAGTRRLIADLDYVEADLRRAPEYRGEFAVVGGGGGWCEAWHAMPDLIRPVEKRFAHVVVLPSSFDVAEPCIRDWVRRTKAQVFAREPVSLAMLRRYRDAELALDGAFFYDYAPYLRPGRGTLHAFRTDREKRIEGLPPDNVDLGVESADLDHYLHTIARCAAVRTDRAHVMIAAAMLGKRVWATNSSYHKVRAIAEYALGSLDVTYEESFAPALYL